MSEFTAKRRLGGRALSRRQALALASFGALAGFLPRNLFAAAPQPASLSPQDQQEVQRVETYLDRIRTLQSRFDQVAGDGRFSSGQLWLSRPGLMRIEYDAPVEVLIVATGGEIYFYDKKLNQLSQINLNETPAWFLLKSDLKLRGDVTVTQFKRDPGALRLQVVETKKPDIGRVTLALTEKPLELRQWTVVDAQQTSVTVTLNDPHYGVALNPNLFIWTDPRPAGSARGG